jgi:hypothetical protein
MRKLVVGVVVAALTLTGAVAAWAVSTAETTHNATFTPGNKREGTPKRPRGNTLVVRLRQGTTTGSGQPATTTVIIIRIPRQWRLLSERWPRSRRCRVATVNQRGTDSVCPRGSRIGGGDAELLASDGTIEEHLDIRAYVTTTGDLGFFLDSPPGEPTEVNTMIVGQTSDGGRLIRINIPTTLQQPIPGIKSSIEEIVFRLNGSTRVRGRRVSILVTTGCRRTWVFTFQSRYDDGGRNSDSNTLRC